MAVLCEYDALPGIGHGCGHNIIAAAGLGAGLAAATVVAACGGRLEVMGTPAEEGGGGKVIMGDRGAFDGVDVALAVHPAGFDLVQPDVIAIATYEVEYFGRAAHAAAAPQRGRNALDAAVLGYNTVAALRQHIAPTDRIHGVFLKAGDKANIVPDHTLAQWFVRSATATSLQALKERVLACLEAGAAAAGCTMEVRQPWPEYTDLRSNGPLGELYRANSARLGRPLDYPTAANRLIVSTDMGNVSYRVPTIHPIVKVSPSDVALHTAGARGVGGVARRRPGGARRGQGHGHDRRRPVASARGPPRGPRRVRSRVLTSGLRWPTRTSASSGPTPRPTSCGGTSPTSTGRCSPW